MKFPKENCTLFYEILKIWTHIWSNNILWTILKMVDSVKTIPYLLKFMNIEITLYISIWLRLLKMWDEMKITLEFCTLSLTGRALK
jgi:hypothetical protein